MAFKDMMKSLIGKKETPVPAQPQDKALLTATDFPIIRAADVDLSKYQKVPLMGIAALGAAFSTLPEAARTITNTVTTQVGTDTPVFAGFWPEGVVGRMVDPIFLLFVIFS